MLQAWRSKWGAKIVYLPRVLTWFHESTRDNTDNDSLPVLNTSHPLHVEPRFLGLLAFHALRLLCLEVLTVYD
jgi:hypothetical protein